MAWTGLELVKLSGTRPLALREADRCCHVSLSRWSSRLASCHARGRAAPRGRSARPRTPRRSADTLLPGVPAGIIGKLHQRGPPPGDVLSGGQQLPASANAGSWPSGVSPVRRKPQHGARIRSPAFRVTGGRGAQPEGAGSEPRLARPRKDPGQATHAFRSAWERGTVDSRGSG